MVSAANGSDVKTPGPEAASGAWAPALASGVNEASGSSHDSQSYSLPETFFANLSAGQHPSVAPPPMEPSSTPLLAPVPFPTVAPLPFNSLPSVPAAAVLASASQPIPQQMQSHAFAVPMAPHAPSAQLVAPIEHQWQPAMAAASPPAQSSVALAATIRPIEFSSTGGSGLGDHRAAGVFGGGRGDIDEEVKSLPIIPSRVCIS